VNAKGPRINGMWDDAFRICLGVTEERRQYSAGKLTTKYLKKKAEKTV